MILNVSKAPAKRWAQHFCARLATLLRRILYFPIAHNSLCLPPKFSINYYCETLLGGLHISKSISQQ